MKFCLYKKQIWNVHYVDAVEDATSQWSCTLHTLLFQWLYKMEPTIRLCFIAYHHLFIWDFEDDFKYFWLKHLIDSTLVAKIGFDHYLECELYIKFRSSDVPMPS